MLINNGDELSFGLQMSQISLSLSTGNSSAFPNSFRLQFTSNILVENYSKEKLIP